MNPLTEYELNYSQVKANQHQQYQSNFLKEVNKVTKGDTKQLFDRFDTNCEYKVMRQGMKELNSDLKSIQRPGGYMVDTSSKKRPNSIEEEQKIKGLCHLGHHKNSQILKFNK